MATCLREAAPAGKERSGMSAVALAKAGGFFQHSPNDEDHRCESGGTGRRARFRISWETVGVQVPPLAPRFGWGSSHRLINTLLKGRDVS